MNESTTNAISPETYRGLREKMDLTQAELAGYLGVTREHVMRRETGKAIITIEATLALFWVARLKGVPIGVQDDDHQREKAGAEGT